MGEVTPFPEEMLYDRCDGWALCVFDEFVNPGGGSIGRVQQYIDLNETTGMNLYNACSSNIIIRI